MRTLIRFTGALLVSVVTANALVPSAAVAQGGGASDALTKEIVALERAALDRWITLDPDGYLNQYTPDITYFDPTTDKRIDGRAAMQERLGPIKTMKSPFTNPRYDLIDPKVQRVGDVAILTFNVVSYGTL